MFCRGNGRTDEERPHLMINNLILPIRLKIKPRGNGNFQIDKIRN